MQIVIANYYYLLSDEEQLKSFELNPIRINKRHKQ